MTILAIWIILSIIISPLLGAFIQASSIDGHVEHIRKAGF